MAGIFSINQARFFDRFVSKYHRLTYPNLKKMESLILMFHDVSDSGEPYSVSSRQFEWIIDSLQSMGYKFCSLKQLVKNKNYIGYVTITFDDVYSSVIDNAFPILQQKKIPFTLFVSTDLLNRAPYISTIELENICKNDLCSLGSHLNHHVMTRNLSKEKIIEEVQESFAILREYSETTENIVALPYGSITACSNQDCNILYEYNIDAILLTTQRAVKRRDLKIPKRLPRIDASSTKFLSCLKMINI